MKNSTARKLEQIPTDYLIVGIDAHKKKHAAVVKTQDAFTRTKFKVDNSRQGFEEVLERVETQVTKSASRGAILYSRKITAWGAPSSGSILGEPFGP